MSEKHWSPGREIYKGAIKFTSLVNQVLSSASPQQKARARSLISSFLTAYGWSSAQHEVEAALDAFDAGEYDNVHIARFLSDSDLASL